MPPVEGHKPLFGVHSMERGMLSRAQRYFVTGAWLSLSVIALINHLTGYKITFFAFYFIPVALATLSTGHRKKVPEM